MRTLLSLILLFSLQSYAASNGLFNSLRRIVTPAVAQRKSLHTTSKKQDYYRSTPLFDAIDASYLPLVKSLLNNGASPTEKNSKGYTPLIASAYRPNHNIMCLLLEFDDVRKKINDQTWDKRKYTALTQLLDRVNDTVVGDMSERLLNAAVGDDQIWNITELDMGLNVIENMAEKLLDAGAYPNIACNNIATFFLGRKTNALDIAVFTANHRLINAFLSSDKMKRENVLSARAILDRSRTSLDRYDPLNPKECESRRMIDEWLEA